MLRFSCLTRGAQQAMRPLRYSVRAPARNVRPRQNNIVADAERSMAGQVIPGYSFGAKATAFASSLGIGALVYNGFRLGGSTDNALDRSAHWPAYIKQRIASSYTYLFNGLLVTGCSTYAILRSPRIMSWASRGGIPMFIGTIVAMIGLQMAVRATPYDPNTANLGKHMAFAAHAGFIGFIIAPLVAMYGEVVTQAALYTGGITAGLSAIGWTAPSQEYLKMAGPMSMLMGAVFMAAIASPFMNPTSPAGGIMFSFMLWGGLIFSGLGIFASTQRMIDQAKSVPPQTAYSHGPHFDPINASLSVYIHMITMFQRMVMILGMNKRK